MKKKICCVALALLLLITPAHAHSGRTDSNGGHYDHSTGEYHYHHGYPAHQHPNGVCPYDFDDKTGQSSGTSGGGGTSSGSQEIQSNSSENDNKKFDLFDFLSSFLFWVVMAGVILYYVWFLIYLPVKALVKYIRGKLEKKKNKR